MEYNAEYEEIKKPSILGIILSPTIHFQRMREQAPLVIPLIILIILTIITSFLTSYVSLNNPYMAEMNEEMGASVPKHMLLLMIGGQAVFWGIIAIFATPIFYKNFMIFFSNDTSYKKLLAITVYSTIIVKIGMLLNGLAACALDDYEIAYTSLAPLFTQNPVIHMIAQQFDVFNIWYFIILVIGMRIVAGLSRNKAIILIVIIFLFTTALRSMAGFMQMVMQG
ncbi:YIP1 family protein [Microbacteriaceae bacterium 4G12]